MPRGSQAHLDPRRKQNGLAPLPPGAVARSEELGNTIDFGGRVRSNHVTGRIREPGRKLRNWCGIEL